MKKLIAVALLFISFNAGAMNCPANMQEVCTTIGTTTTCRCIF